ncbi:MAG TPA: hypothetical protein VMT53_21885 [Terriglobales bacterium]|nr:hypothetical protein [Terriglobales bacterium]
MPSTFVQLQASEEQDLRHFLLTGLAADPGYTPFRPEVLRWKYFADHPEWNGSRSYAIRKDGKIVAHGGVWPVSLVTPDAEIKAIHLIDWASNRSAVGSGVQLLRRVAQLGDVLLTIGGSADTRAILPKLGYTQRGELHRYVRVIRPWLQFSTTPRKNWTSAFKLIRNSTLVLRPLPPLSQNCQVSQLSSFSGLLDSRAIGQGSHSAVSRRTAAGINYLMSCPAGRFSGFVANCERWRGYFVLAQIGRQARIIDMGTDATDSDSWRALCLLAARTAAENPEICEIVAASSVRETEDTWSQLGFIRGRTEPIFSYDPRQLLSTRTPLSLSMADGDLCFLSNPRTPYIG